MVKDHLIKNILNIAIGNNKKNYFYGSYKMFSQVKKYAQQIKGGVNKVIYVKDNNVYLIDKKDLPKSYYQKTDILFVDNPEQYLLEINKRKPTPQELKQFILIDLPIDETIYGEIIPPELIREQLLKLPIQDIIRNRRTSKEFKNVIDKNEFWCNLIERDYKGEEYDKTKCHEEYIDMYRRKNMLFVTLEKLKEISEKYNLNINIFVLLLENHYFKRKRNVWYFYPKDILKSDIFFDNIEKLSKDMDYSLPIADLNNYVQILETNYPVGLPSFDYYLYKKIRDILPSGIIIPNIDMFRNPERKLVIGYNEFIEAYEASYGKGSFDKDFIKVMTEILETKNSKYNETSQQLLLKYHNFADERDKQLNEGYLALKNRRGRR